MYTSRRCFWYNASDNHEDVRLYYSDFLWTDYCLGVRLNSVCSAHLTEVVIPNMKAYIYKLSLISKIVRFG